MRELQQYDVAVSNFKTKYNSIPGDSTVMSPAGNGNGYIDFFCGDDWSNQSSNELGFFLQHLQQSGFVPKNTYSITDQGSLTFSVPVMTYSKKAMLVGVSYSNVGTSCRINPPCDDNCNYYKIVDWNQEAVLDNYNPVFPTSDALAIDTKIDDGIANTGNVIGGGDFCRSSGNYDLSQTGVQCEMSILMLISSNQRE